MNDKDHDLIKPLPREGITSIDDPKFSSDYFGENDDLMLVLESEESTPRAYPTRILDYHHLVNDTIGDKPIIVTWCPLCGSGVIFKRTIDQTVLEFGFSGKLVNNDMVMYDRETESEWQQSTGECLSGEFEGERLPFENTRIIPWNEVRDEYRDVAVLERPNRGREARPFFEFIQTMMSPAESEDDSIPNHSKALIAHAEAKEASKPFGYDVNLFENYRDMPGFGFGVRLGQAQSWERDDLEPKTFVLGVIIDDRTIGFPKPVVDQHNGVVQTTVGDTDVVVFSTEDSMYAYEDPGYTFERANAGNTYIANEVSWNPVSGRSADGWQLNEITTVSAFAFTWQYDHGPDSFYRL